MKVVICPKCNYRHAATENKTSYICTNCNNTWADLMVNECGLSQRGKDWLEFSGRVLDHIETYTVPQYGDRGNDQCTEFNENDFLTNIRRYLNRHGKNVREGQDKLDKIKMAHYAQMLHDLIEE